MSILEFFREIEPIRCVYIERFLLRNWLRHLWRLAGPKLQVGGSHTRDQGKSFCCSSCLRACASLMPSCSYKVRLFVLFRPTAYSMRSTRFMRDQLYSHSISFTVNFIKNTHTEMTGIMLDHISGHHAVTQHS